MTTGAPPPPPAAPDEDDRRGVGKVPHDRPSAAELVEAVREFLENDVVARSEGRVRFHARVATNVLDIVLRELAMGAEQAQMHADRLRTLGVVSESELAQAIRSGALDDRLDEVRAVVRATVADKLEVAHPGYTDPASGAREPKPARPPPCPPA